MNEEVENRVIRALVRGVLALLALVGIALVAVNFWLRPNLLGEPLACGESAAIATLKNIASGQMAFHERAAVDRDGDGIGEFGWLTEMAAAQPVRGDPNGRRLEPAVLSSLFGDLSQGFVWWHGYLFELWLPGRGGTWLRHGAAFEVDVDAAESAFCVYAWPERASEGRRAFFVDAAGDILASHNEAGYLGPDRAPPVDAALPSSHADAERGDWGHTGRDGSIWVCVQ